MDDAMKAYRKILAILEKLPEPERRRIVEALNTLMGYGA